MTFQHATEQWCNKYLKWMKDKNEEFLDSEKRKKDKDFSDN